MKLSNPFPELTSKSVKILLTRYNRYVEILKETPLAGVLYPLRQRLWNFLPNLKNKQVDSYVSPYPEASKDGFFFTDKKQNPSFCAFSTQPEVGQRLHHPDEIKLANKNAQVWKDWAVQANTPRGFEDNFPSIEGPLGIKFMGSSGPAPQVNMSSLKSVSVMQANDGQQCVDDEDLQPITETATPEYMATYFISYSLRP